MRRQGCQLGALLAMALAVVTGPAAAGDARITVLNAARVPESVSVELCGKPNDICQEFEVDRDGTREEVALLLDGTA